MVIVSKYLYSNKNKLNAGKEKLPEKLWGRIRLKRKPILIWVCKELLGQFTAWPPEGVAGGWISTPCWVSCHELRHLLLIIPNVLLYLYLPFHICPCGVIVYCCVRFLVFLFRFCHVEFLFLVMFSCTVYHLFFMLCHF